MVRALVTGGTRGIGYEIAKGLIAKNIETTILGQQQNRVSKAAAELGATAVCCDVRDYRQIPLEVDPPRHHLYRAALAPFFVKPTIEKMAPDFRKISQDFIDDVLPNGTDIVSKFALPLVMKNLGVIYNRPQDVAEWISWGTSAGLS